MRLCVAADPFFFGTGTKESKKRKPDIFWEACLSVDVQKLPTGYLTTPSCWLLHTLAHALYITQTAGEQLSEESVFAESSLLASSPLTSLTSWKTWTGVWGGALVRKNATWKSSAEGGGGGVGHPTLSYSHSNQSAVPTSRYSPVDSRWRASKVKRRRYLRGQAVKEAARPLKREPKCIFASTLRIEIFTVFHK